MATPLALALFCVSLAVTLVAARTFAGRLDQVGEAVGLPEALIGLLTALAADGPEISSALVALARGDRGASLGVVTGSNIFNLAAMLGLSALVAGGVRLRRESLALEGGVGAAATLIVIALVAGWLSAAPTAALLAAVLVPYALVLARGEHLALRVPVLARALGPRRHAGARTRGRTPATALLIPIDVALIVTGSVGMVETALTLASRWHIAAGLVGVLVLGPLTSVPNAATAIRLALANRGTALVSEAMNSNTINLVVGVALPALVTTIARPTRSVAFDLAAMAVMTAVTLALLARRDCLTRRAGVVLILMYVAFVAVQATL